MIRFTIVRKKPWRWGRCTVKFKKLFKKGLRRAIVLRWFRKWSKLTKLTRKRIIAAYEIKADDDMLQDLLFGNDDALASLLQQVLNQILDGQ
jgi:hypothetical protein